MTSIRTKPPGSKPFAGSGSYPVLAQLPHDPVITQAMIQGLVVTELPETAFSRELRQAWTRIEDLAGLRPVEACQA